MVWADDLWVFARSRNELDKMVTEVREAWDQAGLQCRDGCRVWASEQQGGEVECGGWNVKVQESLKILGHDFGTTAGEDLQMAMARGWRAFWKAAPQLRNRSLSWDLRARQWVVKVAPALCWAASTWTWTSATCDVFTSTVHRMFRVMRGSRKHPDESIT